MLNTAFSIINSPTSTLNNNQAVICTDQSISNQTSYLISNHTISTEPALNSSINTWITSTNRILVNPNFIQSTSAIYSNSKSDIPASSELINQTIKNDHLREDPFIKKHEIAIVNALPRIDCLANEDLINLNEQKTFTNKEELTKDKKQIQYTCIDQAYACDFQTNNNTIKYQSPLQNDLKSMNHSVIYGNSNSTQSSDQMYGSANPEMDCCYTKPYLTNSLNCLKTINFIPNDSLSNNSIDTNSRLSQDTENIKNFQHSTNLSNINPTYKRYNTMQDTSHIPNEHFIPIFDKSKSLNIQNDQDILNKYYYSSILKDNFSPNPENENNPNREKFLPKTEFVEWIQKLDSNKIKLIIEGIDLKIGELKLVELKNKIDSCLANNNRNRYGLLPTHYPDNQCLDNNLHASKVNDKLKIAPAKNDSNKIEFGVYCSGYQNNHGFETEYQDLCSTKQKYPISKASINAMNQISDMNANKGTGMRVSRTAEDVSNIKSESDTPQEHTQQANKDFKTNDDNFNVGLNNVNQGVFKSLRFARASTINEKDKTRKNKKDQQTNKISSPSSQSGLPISHQKSFELLMPKDNSIVFNFQDDKTNNILESGESERVLVSIMNPDSYIKTKIDSYKQFETNQYVQSAKSISLPEDETEQTNSRIDRSKSLEYNSNKSQDIQKISSDTNIDNKDDDDILLNKKNLKDKGYVSDVESNNFIKFSRSKSYNNMEDNPSIPHIKEDNEADSTMNIKFLRLTSHIQERSKSVSNSKNNWMKKPGLELLTSEINLKDSQKVSDDIGYVNTPGKDEQLERFLREFQPELKQNEAKALYDRLMQDDIRQRERKISNTRSIESKKIGPLTKKLSSSVVGKQLFTNCIKNADNTEKDISDVQYTLDKSEKTRKRDIIQKTRKYSKEHAKNVFNKSNHDVNKTKSTKYPSMPKNLTNEYESGQKIPIKKHPAIPKVASKDAMLKDRFKNSSNEAKKNENSEINTQQHRTTEIINNNIVGINLAEDSENHPSSKLEELENELHYLRQLRINIEKDQHTLVESFKEYEKFHSTPNMISSTPKLSKQNKNQNSDLEAENNKIEKDPKSNGKAIKSFKEKLHIECELDGNTDTSGKNKNHTRTPKEIIPKLTDLELSSFSGNNISKESDDNALNSISLTKSGKTPLNHDKKVLNTSLSKTKVKTPKSKQTKHKDFLSAGSKILESEKDKKLTRNEKKIESEISALSNSKKYMNDKEATIFVTDLIKKFKFNLNNNNKS